MNNKEITDLFGNDRAHFAMIAHSLADKNTVILYADTDGLLLNYNGIDMLYGTKDENAAKRILSLLPRTDMIVCSSPDEANLVRRFYGNIKTAKPCYQVRYEKAADCLLENGAVIEPMTLTKENFDLVYETYTLHYDYEEVVKLISNGGFLICRLNGKAAGYIGRHDEGSIGLLEVFPFARGLGLGSALLCAAVKNTLARGEIAYSNIIRDNEASLKLHARLGYFPSDKFIFWCL